MIKEQRLLFVLFILSSLYCNAQTVILNYDKATEPSHEKGPNQKKFVQGFFQFGMVTPPDPNDTQIKYGSSVSIALGVRKKFKVSSIYSLGWEATIQYEDFKFKKAPTLLSPTGSSIDTRRFDISSISLGMFNRINFDPNRGNFMGTYLDLGIDGAFAYSMKEVYKYSTGYGEAVTKVGGLDYTNMVQSDVFAKLGYSKFSIWAKYRITDLFKASSEQKELPRISAGIELGLY